MAGSDSLRSLHAVDALILLFLLLLAFLALIVVDNNSERLLLLSFNFIACGGILYLARSAKHSHNTLVRAAHDWYPVPFVYLAFKEIYIILQSLGREDYDQTLIAIDRWLFSADPTVIFFKFASPIITEILQIAYASFYFLLIASALEPYMRKEYDKFSVVMFAIIYGFFLSYVGYLIVPGVGPRFTLHNFDMINTELPGLFLTEPIRYILNAGESIPNGVVNALALAHRDVFPSGHTEMTLIAIYFAAKYKLKLRYALYVLGTLLIIATVYLRYHYVIDLIAGVVFMWFTVWTTPKLLKIWEKIKSQRL